MRLTQPLHVHISTLFLALTLLIGGLIGWHGYRTSAELVQASASEQSGRIGRQVQEEFRNALEPAEMAIKLVRYHRITWSPTLAERLASLDFLGEVLEGSPALSAIYVGYPNGDFFLLRRLNTREQGLTGAPAEARYLVQSIERGARPRGRYIYLDAAREVIQTLDQPDYVQAYDPRRRGWWQQAQAASGLVQTEPYPFFTSRSVGITLAARARAAESVVGADIDLATLGSRLARQKVTPGTQLALVSGRGELVAHERIAELLPADGQARTGLPPLAALQSPALDQLVERRGLGRDAGLQAERDDDGATWYTAAVAVPRAGAPDLHLLMAIPDAELMAGARQQLAWSAAMTLLVIVLSIPVTWWLARLISQPLRRLVHDVEAIRHFDFQQPIAVDNLVKETHDLALTLQGMQGTIRHFLELSIVVASEENFERLLPRLLGETLYAAQAQAGVLYLSDGTRLIPSCALRPDDHALDAQELGSLATLQLPDEDLSASALVGPLMGRALQQGQVGSQALTDADLQALQLGPSGLAAGLRYGMAIPLMNRRHERVGAMLLLLDEPPDEAQVSFVAAFSGSAAVSLEARELIQQQKQLFEAFIQLIASAIDAKSPYTGGHCARVPELTKMLARAACAQTDGPFADFALSEQAWEAVHVAAWLHDCGKVTTPEYVVDKSTKLETLYDRIHEVRMRFEVLKRDAVIAMHEAVAAGRSAAQARAEMAQACRALDEDYAFVAACNEGGEYLSPEKQERLKTIAQRTWLRTLDDRLGISHEERTRKAREPAPPLPVAEPLLADRAEHRIERNPQDQLAPDNPWGFKVQVPELLYNRGELYNLLVSRGTLSAEERYKINEHMVQTIKMLTRLPFPKHLRNVPEIAGGHHEKMDGTGYPRRLRREDMSPVARMMAIADIFEALTAVDRPYKQGKTLSEALRIMAAMRKDQHIDPELFELFLRSGVYREYAERYMQAALIDTIDIEDYLT
jgi:HD-GYP domain-containing protein (c-di-GMP phosphodiesterase class II)